MRTTKRYVRDNEIKLSKQRPADGQIVLVREYGFKSYHTAQYDAAADAFVHAFSDSVFQALYVNGWLPVSKETETTALAKLAEKGTK